MTPGSETGAKRAYPIVVPMLQSKSHVSTGARNIPWLPLLILAPCLLLLLYVCMQAEQVVMHSSHAVAEKLDLQHQLFESKTEITKTNYQASEIRQQIYEKQVRASIFHLKLRTALKALRLPILLTVIPHEATEILTPIPFCFARHQPIASGATLARIMPIRFNADVLIGPDSDPAPPELFQTSFARAMKLRTNSKPGVERGLVLYNCHILNPSSGSLSAEPTDVLLIGGKIEAVGHSIDWGSASNNGEEDFVIIDCQGLTLMPGLCDAHVHCTAITANLPALMSYPESYVTAKAAEILNGMLYRGFTTVRDAGGADLNP
eukprot:gene22469-29588_t